MSVTSKLGQWWFSTRAIILVIGRVLTAVALVSFASQSSGLELSEILNKLLLSYQELRDRLLSPVGELLELAFLKFGLEIRTSNLWAESVGVMGTYFLTDYMQNYVGNRRPIGLHLTTLLNGLSVTLIFSLLGDNLGGVGEFNIIYPILGFSMYELIKAPITATWLRAEQHSFWQALRWYIVLFAGMNLLLGFVATLPKTIGLPGYNEKYDVILLIAFWALLIIRNLAVTAYRQAFVETNLPGSKFENFIGSGSVKIAMSLSVIIFLFLAILAANTLLT